MFFRGYHRLFPPGEWKDELLRWGFLLAVVSWLFHPFLTGRAIGTGDAIWYEHMLADFVLQWRAGIFPVFVGQTEYAFNGAVYPLRVAPLFQHWAGVLDLLTFHRLSFFWLQHLVVVTVAFAGTGICYLCLVAMAPHLRWLAAFLAALYISCPGVLGVIVTQDLYMSWMTLPFLPIVMFGLARSFVNDDSIAWSAISGGLAALWLGHAPIALWATMITTALQLFRLLGSCRNAAAWRRAVTAGIVFVLLAQYPFVSIATLQNKNTAPVASGALDHSERIVHALQSAFPGCLYPLTLNANQLSDLQLGYALYGSLLVGVLAVLIVKERRPLIFIIPITALCLLLFPIPHWTLWFWTQFSPQFLRRLTFYWPMHRFYILMASMAAFGGMIGSLALCKKWPAAVKPISLAMALGCFWSLWQARELVSAEQIRTASRDDTIRKELPENRLLMVHSYGLFAQIPSTFSNGVVDPRSEIRLLNPETGLRLSGSTLEIPVQNGIFIGHADSNQGVIDLEPTLILRPHQHYILKFDFRLHNDSGILQMVGPTFFREYILPTSGEEHSFGSKTLNSNKLDIWSTSVNEEPVRIRLILEKPVVANPSNNSFAEFTLSRINEGSQAIRIKSWDPLVISIDTAEDSILQTPRISIPTYRVKVNEKTVPTTVSSDGELEVRLGKGHSHVTIRYQPPTLLLASYWLEIVAFLAATIWISLQILAPSVLPRS